MRQPGGHGVTTSKFRIHRQAAPGMHINLSCAPTPSHWDVAHWRTRQGGSGIQQREEVVGGLPKAFQWEGVHEEGEIKGRALRGLIQGCPRRQGVRGESDWLVGAAQGWKQATWC